MSLTPEAPGPWILNNVIGTQALLGCDGARKVIVEWLYLGEEIGEDDLFITYDNVYAVVAPWAEMVKEVHDIYIAAMKGEVNLPDDTDYERVLFLQERATFYLEELERVRDDELWYQRQEIYTFILRPLLFGMHFESYFDSDSAVIQAPADYCLPQLLANNLGYTANYYRNFGMLVNYMLFSQEAEDAWVEFWFKKPAEAVGEAIQGPLEKSHRWIDEHAAPVMKNLSDIGGAATDVATETVKTLAKIVKNPFGTAVALGAFLYFIGTRK